MKQFLRVCLLLTAGVAVAGNASGALVAYYPFNGTGNDKTGLNVNLGLVGNAAYANSVVSSLGRSLSLDGMGDGAIAPNFVKITGNNMTAVAWVNAASLDGDWNSIVKNWGTAVGGQFHFGLGNAAANTLQSIAAGATNVASPNVIPTNEWIHTAFVLDAPALQHRLYINGQVVATAAYTGTLGAGTATGLGVGHKPNDNGTALDGGGGPGPWNGRIDEVGLYNEALTTAQILQIYQNGLAGIQLDGSRTPEPSTMVMLLLGTFAALGRRPIRAAIAG